MSESVTLKSYFYEVLIPSSQKNTSSPIEDILHHVSISFMKKLALYKCFNPRTHTGCDGSSPRLPLRSKSPINVTLPSSTSEISYPRSIISRFSTASSPKWHGAINSILLIYLSKSSFALKKFFFHITFITGHCQSFP